MADSKDSKLTEAAMAPDTDMEHVEVAKPEESNMVAEGAEAEVVEEVNSVPMDGGATAAPADPEVMAMTTPKADED
ncbi:MAG: hypothetical protein AAF716_19195 [Cyanobacteria bacterium P01_D01_bin.1]